MSSRKNRTSLSDWYVRPDVDSDDSDEEGKEDGDSVHNGPMKSSFSPTKRSIQNFDMADNDSDCQSLDHSPRKRLTMSPRPASSLVGSPGEACINTAMMSILRGICADYFENNVSPILRYVQQTQEQLISKIKEVTCTVDRKASVEDVDTVVESAIAGARIATSRSDDRKVAVQVRLEELAAAMKLKANVKDVPTLAQLAVKANAKDVPTSAQLEGLAATVQRKLDIDDVPAPQDMAELQGRMRAAEERVAALSGELRDLRMKDTVGAPADAAEFTKVRSVFVAAGVRFDKKLKAVEVQMQKLRDECLGKDVGERWPGRKIDAASIGSMNSDNNSDHLSLGASATPSLTSTTLGTEERAELKKIHAIVTAAGNVFSREFRDVKGQMREVKADLQSVKKKMGL